MCVLSSNFDSNHSALWLSTILLYVTYTEPTSASVFSLVDVVGDEDAAAGISRCVSRPSELLATIETFARPSKFFSSMTLTVLNLHFICFISGSPPFYNMARGPRVLTSQRKILLMWWPNGDRWTGGRCYGLHAGKKTRYFQLNYGQSQWTQNQFKL